MSKGSTAVPYRPLDMLETRDGTPSNKDARMTNVLLEAHGTEAAFIKRTGFAKALSALGTPYGATAFTDSNGNPNILSVNAGSANVIVQKPASDWTLLQSGVTIGSDNLKNSGPIIIYNNYLYAFKLGLTATSIYKSSDGFKWELVTSTAFSGVSTLGSDHGPIVFNGKMYYYPQSNGHAYSSTDGATWTDLGATSGNIVDLFVVGSTIYSVFPSNGVNIYTSTDGKTFTSGSVVSGSPTGQPIVFNGAMYYIDGSTPAVFRSTNGFTWTNIGTPGFSTRSGFGLTVHNNQLVVGGGDTSKTDLWASSDGITWVQAFTNTSPTGILTGALTTFWQGTGSATNFTGSRLLSYKGYLYALGSYTSNSAYYSKRSPSSSTAINVATSTTTTIPGFSVSSSSYRPYDPIDFSQTLDRTKLAMKNSVGAWQMTVSSGAVVQVTDGDYPTTTVRGLAYLNGVFYVMDANGTIYGSGTNDFTTWTALNRVTAQSEPDGGMCLTKYGQYIIAFGNYTTEFFYDAGNATGSPLSSVQNGQFMVGCSNGDTVAQIEKTIFFVSQRKVQGQATGKGFGVSKLEGFNISDVSTEDVERVLNADGLFGAWATTVNFLGHDCYMMSLPTTGISLLYDTQSKMWSYINYQAQGNSKTVSALTCAAPVVGMTTGVATATSTAHGFSDGDPVTIAGATPSGYNGTFNITYVDANTFTYPTASVLANATGTITARGYTATAFPLMMAFEFSGSQIFQNPDGGLYEIIDTLYQDNSAYIDTKIRTSRSSKGLKEDQNQQPKFISWADIVTDRVSANMLLRYTDDDYQTYSNYQSVSLSPKRSRITRLGRTIRRAWELRHTDNSAMRLQYMELGIEQGDE